MKIKQITIIGLGYIGTSIALGLRTKYSNNIKIIGYDSNQDVQRKTKKSGLVDETPWNLPNSVKNSEIVVIATPPNSVKEIFSVISGNLSENSVVTDTSVTKRKILQWADEYIPKKFIGGNPLVGGLEGNNIDPSGYIFSDSKWALLPAKNTPENKVNKIVNFIQDLGAKPFFIDPLEHDSYTVATSVLPFIFSTTLMNIVSESPSWHEMSQFAGKEFNNVTSPSKNLPDISYGSIETTNEILIDWIQRSIQHLDLLKKELENINLSDNNLLDLVNNSWEERIRLDAGLANRRKTDEERPKIPSSSEGMMSLFFGSRFARVLSGNDKKKGNDKKSNK